MSTETKRTIHPIEQLTRGAVLYLRNAINNPSWAEDPLEDYLKGADVLRLLPKELPPKEVLASDEAFLSWAEPICLPLWEITDEVRDTCRKALKFAFDKRNIAINEHGALLIRAFGLKVTK